ncbi:hydrolase [Mycobacteroides abscessus subsp. massiliense]|uniref:alpha/beta fold hydrolase n=1 Tax=Mycobacteroides abscessus TaxID=36809 RepID=UPI0009A877F0|nr:alpha/beta hydrolase [Mycobacteroides abscessus]MBE5502421.1 hypothetical protein [Mycobacteroides abscessus]SLH57957.1 hydrolase [Mycobacteroides abscessus subsp. massiliense]
MAIAEVNGQRLAYDEHGSGDALLWAHNLLLDRSFWGPLIESLPTWRSVAWDCRYHGDTVGDGQPVTMSDLADDALALMDHLDIDTAVWIGEGTGVTTALHAALKAPDRVRALVLIGGTATSSPPEEASAVKAVLESWVAHGPETGVFMSTALAAVGGNTDAAHDLIARWKRARWREFTPLIELVTERPDLTDRLHEIQCPTLVMHGTCDLFVDPQEAETIFSGISGSRYEPIHDVQQGLSILYDARVGQHLRSFLTDILDGAQQK